MKKYKKYLQIFMVLFTVIIITGCTNTTKVESNSEKDNIITSEKELGEDSKVLVVYFSYSGNTKKLAEEIYNQVGGDLRRIERIEEYPKGDAIYDVSEKEASEDARPEYKDLEIDINDYDYVFIGYPIWAYNMPQIMYSFFDDYDLGGKVIIPFNTHNGAKDAGTYSKIKKLEPDATVLEGLPIMGNSMDKDQSKTINEWLERIF